jgi:DNA-binding NarL/FixJ family response regulator
MGLRNDDLALNPQPSQAHHVTSSTSISPSVHRPQSVSIRLLIVADYPVVRHGLRQIFGGTMDIHIVDEASNEVDAIQRITVCHPDVVLIDFVGRKSYRLFCRLQQHHPYVPLLIFSAMHDRYAHKAFKRGGMGYVTKDQVPDHLVLAVRQIVRGEKYTLRKAVSGLRVQLHSLKMALVSSLPRLRQRTASSPQERMPLHR